MGFSFDLTGRTAFVTGASSGLGTRFGRILAASGAKVALGARRADRLEALADRIGAAALPAHLPLAVEERSAALRDAYPDLVERARQCARTSRSWLAGRT